MKKICLIITLSFVSIFAFAQSKKAVELTNEGVELHDKGEYAKAIAKYDEAIAEDPTYINSVYEKTLTLFNMKKYDECIVLSKKVIKDFPDNKLLKGVYVQYGSCLDELGNGKQAIKIYDEGLKVFPNYFLLNFNKGITYLIMQDNKKATDAFQAALIDNPFHSSSYYRIADQFRNSNHIPTMLSCIMYLMVENKSSRADEVHNALLKLMYDGVKKTGENATTITMDASMFDTKKDKKDVDNFRSSELLFKLSSASDKDSVLSNIVKTDIEKFDFKLQLLINSMIDDGNGFFKERYVPFFKKLKEKGFTMIVSRLVFKVKNDERNSAWLKTNTGKVDAFYDWLQKYKWPTKE